MAASPLVPGLLTLHSHRAENLLETVVAWLAQHPLEPLEEEVLVVQSNAVAEWLKMALAQRLGVCAATRVELPGRLFWRISRNALGRQQVPAELPLDKLPLTWRLMQALPELATDAALGLPLPSGDDERAVALRLQTCQRLADLFDQYQVYRPDWLADWSDGRAVLRTPRGDTVAVPPEQAWQPVLWRHLVQRLSPAQQAALRPRLHQALLQRLQDTPVAPAGQPPALAVPRRVVVFGLGQVPPGWLALMAGLARHSQVLLAVPNPCQYHWSDIMDGRELLRQATPRHPQKNGADLATVPLEDMHHHAHPLLAAWGRQTRDAVRLLDLWADAPADDAPQAWPRIDRFDDPHATEAAPLLLQVQRRIRDLVPLAEHAQQPDHGWTPADRSIVFHVAHSPVRELEVLHDHLLALLAHRAAEENSAPAPIGHAPLAGLRPRDVVVMVPNLDAFAPAIQAVFGQYSRGDPRHIPFDVADLGVERLSPLVAVWTWLWRLPNQRVTHTEWQTLLDLPTVQARFDLPADDRPRLARWMAQAGVRWGLHAAHRGGLGLGACGPDQTARFGLSRLLAGVLVGDAADALGDVTPCTEATGLDGQPLGGLAHLLDALDRWWQTALQPATPAVWVARGLALLRDLLEPAEPAAPSGTTRPRGATASPADAQALAALRQAGDRWLAACEQAGFDREIDLDTARAAWLSGVQPQPLDGRFQAGGVTFCTLLPMRTVPFRVVCLLGMNEGDYPRRAPRSDHDLMALPGLARPGDRSRRDDDRQLMLDALLSARDRLIVSWCGRSVRDQTAQPPSVLVAQLRDYLAAAWGPEVLRALTVEHPLQPFSRRYFEETPSPLPWFTHVHEWRLAHIQKEELKNQYSRAPVPFFVKNSAFDPPEALRGSAEHPLTLAELADTLAHPARAFMRRRLGVHWRRDASPLPLDDEPFALDGLQTHQLLTEALEHLPVDTPPGQAAPFLQRWLQRTARSGVLPLGVAGPVAQAQLLLPLTRLLRVWDAVRLAFDRPTAAVWCDLADGHTVLTDAVQALWADDRWAHRTQDPRPDPLAHWPALGDAQALRLQVNVRRMLAKGADRATRPDPSRTRPPSGAASTDAGATPLGWSALHRPQRWVGEWVHSLALSASAPSPRHAHTLLVGRDACLHLRPVAPDAARSRLLTLLAAWRACLEQPQPLPWDTAWAAAAQAAGGGAFGPSPRAVYEGDGQQAGEAADPYWARTFPDFDRLTQHPRWAEWAETLVRPFQEWIATQVDVWPHADAGPETGDPRPTPEPTPAPAHRD